MRVRPRVLANAPPAHDDKADAVDEAEAAPACCEESGHAGSAVLGGHSFDIQQRQEPVDQNSDWIETPTPLSHCHGLQDDVVGGDQSLGIDGGERPRWWQLVGAALTIAGVSILGVYSAPG